MKLSITIAEPFSVKLKYEAHILDMTLTAHASSLILTGFNRLHQGWPPYGLHELESIGVLRPHRVKLYRFTLPKGGNILDAAADLVRLYESRPVECPRGHLDAPTVIRRALYLGWRGA